MASGVFEDVRSLESRLGLPARFYEALRREDDWSFIVKLSALFEAACTHALVQRLRSEELLTPFSQLELADPKKGKVVMLKALGAISSEQAAIINKVAAHRNELVHQISNVAFRFDEYVASLDSNQRKSLVLTFGHGLNDPQIIGAKAVPKSQFVLENPKLAIWLTCAEILACLYQEFVSAQTWLDHMERISMHSDQSASNPIFGLD